MKITIIPDDVNYPTRLNFMVKDFSYGEDVLSMCTKMEIVLNKLINDKEHKNVKGR